MPGIPESREEAAVALADASARNLRRALRMLAQRDDKDCTPQPGANLCEKPTFSTTKLTWIIVGTVL